MNYLKFAVILLFCFLNLFSQTENTTQKSLMFLNKMVNFGDVTSDTTLLAKFFFVNNGIEPVKIEYVNPDCTCTSYSLSQKTVNVNDTAYVELQINTSHKYGYNKIYSTMKADTHAQMYKLTIIFNITE